MSPDARQTRADGTRHGADRLPGQLGALVVETSSDFIGISTTEGIPVFVNAAALEMVGLTWEEMLATRVLDYFVEEEQGFVQETVLPAVLEKGRWSGELTFRHFKTGARIPVLYDVFRIDDPATGQPVNFATITRDLTAQKAKDAQLLAAQERIASILNAAEVGTWTHEIGSGRFIGDTNLARMFGMPPIQSEGLSLAAYLEKIHPDDRERVEQALDQALRTGSTFLAEYRVPRDDGPARWVIARGNVERDADGKPARLPGVVLDITDRKEAELALATERNKLQTIFEKSPAAMAMWRGEELVFEMANPEYRAIFEGRELLGRPLLDAVPELAGQEFPHLIRQVLETGEPFVGHEVLARLARRKDGPLEDRYYDFSYVRIDDSDGNPYGVYDHALDVTERVLARRAREELVEAVQRSEANLRTLAESLPDMVWTADPNGEIVWINDVLPHTTGVRREQILGAGFWNLIHPDDAPDTRGAWNRAFRSGVPFEFQHRVRQAGGEWRWHLVRGTPIVDGSGAIDRWIGTSTDIQDQKQLQQQNERLLDSERAARSTAEHAGRMKDEFLATLSHELRTPLSAILGWTQLLRTSDINREELQEGLQTIERNARTQAQLIEDLLDMSRIISGKLRLEVHPVQPRTFIESAIETVKPAAAAKGIHIETILDPKAGPISADVHRMQQVVWNLLSNAIKFTPWEGRVNVVLSRSDSQVEITVSDTGQGIGAEFLPHVFDRFRQADASSNRQHSGLGLGLAIVKQLVELHGGTVQVSSEGKNRGATFTVALPVHPPSAVDDRNERLRIAAEPPVGEPGWRTADLSGLRILVVDDHRDARELLRRVLESRGATVLTAASAKDALEAILTHRPGIVISDIAMPETDGYELLSRVRALSPREGGQIPVVALTAFARPEDRTQALLAGFLAHLAKPVDPSELVATIVAISGRAARSDAGPPAPAIAPEE